jgi:Transglutaminase-like superfamily
VLGGIGITMKPGRIFEATWKAVNVLFALSVVLFIVTSCWEYSTRRYLHGFADAIVPATATPIEKAEAILNWMEHGPTRRDAPQHGNDNIREPEESLNYASLLKVCGSATNAFVNLANSGGLPARRLLLMSERRDANHVVAEIWTGDKWIVVDPSFRFIPRGVNGQPLTREELSDPDVFERVVQSVPHYDPRYNYEHTSHLRLARLPVIGRALRAVLDWIAPGWSDSIYVTLLAERRSFAAALVSGFLCLFLFLARLIMRRISELRFGTHHVRFRDRLWRAFQIFLQETN